MERSKLANEMAFLIEVGNALKRLAEGTPTTSVPCVDSPSRKNGWRLCHGQLFVSKIRSRLNKASTMTYHKHWQCLLR